MAGEFRMYSEIDEILFNIENLGYLRYKLRCITSLTSRYAYVMFIYLESNRYRRSWEVPLDELKIILNCDNEETYKEYKRFNDRLMKRVHKELTEKTECQYKYESVKKGRSVVAIRFTVFHSARLSSRRMSSGTSRRESNRMTCRFITRLWIIR